VKEIILIGNLILRETMLSLYNILTIVKYEVKTLLRSWFFRIFSGIILVILFLYNLTAFTETFQSFIPRDMYGMTSSIPYTNILLFNIGAAVIAVFLASDFLKRDKKLDTSEVIYIRSMTNVEYVFGKALALFLVFLILNLIVILISFGFNLFAQNNNILPSAYLYYFFLISVPTIIFITGLSFLIMTIIKNQAITFILLLGYIAVTLFYIGSKFYNLFDYTGIYLPFLYSDFIGFGNFTSLLLLRTLYFSLGISFIFFTTVLFKRLPQSPLLQKVTIVLAFVFLGIGLVTGFSYVNSFVSSADIRVSMKKLNNEYALLPRLTFTENKINLVHNGNSISVVSEIDAVNNNTQSLKQATLKLNPGLEITKITSNNAEIDFTRKEHLVILSFKNSIITNGKINLKFEYSGEIYDFACYLDQTDEMLNKPKRIWLFAATNQFSFITPSFVLLTQECMWYPTSGISYSFENQLSQPFDFTKFQLTINKENNLTAISQGIKLETNEANFVFVNDNPLPQISLTIGNYVEKTLSVDSVNYSLYTLANHNYYEEYSNELGDTLKPLIRELKQDYERELNISYPYNKLNLVEVPIQFTSYRRFWKTGYEYVQPQIVFLPENAIQLSEADFKLRERMQSRFGNRSNQVVLPIENQSNNFKNFVNGTLLDKSSRIRFRFNANPNEIDEKPYSIFSNFYYFTNHINSKKYPAINIAIENYLSIAEDNSSVGFARNILGVTPDESAAMKLSSKSLAEIVSDTTFNRYLNSIVKLKSKYFFVALANEIGKENLSEIIIQFLNESKFSSIDMQDFENYFRKYELDIKNQVDSWSNNKKLPGFYFTNIQNYKIVDNERERYQIKMNISNPSETDGFIKLTFNPRRERGGGFFGRDNSEEETIFEEFVKIPLGKTLSYSTVLDEEPGSLIMNTFLSQNLPLQQQVNFQEFGENKKAKPIVEKVVLNELDKFSSPYEYIVDNEDSGFVANNPQQSSWLKKFLNMEDSDTTKYIGVRPWSLPEAWRATINSDTYGKFIHSAHFAKSGEGKAVVNWKVNIEKSGYYDIYTHIIKPNAGFRRRDEESDSKKREYHYIVSHDDGDEEINLDFNNSEVGWNLLGSFYLSAGEAKVSLNNESENSVVFADAIKWVERN